MRELVVLSGKGGTGKTSIVAAFASLAASKVLADCDVDAADLHLILTPKIQTRRRFVSGHVAIIRQEACNGCGVCSDLCQFGAITLPDSGAADHFPTVIPHKCEGCGVCVHFCPENAIDFPERECGEWYVSATRHGTMVHARLDVAAENSGKLVTLVRKQARQLADEQGQDLILVDGPPGIGCPVIATLGGADMLLAVTEPTSSGWHDLMRLFDLADHFGVPAAVCINKADLNPQASEQMAISCEQRGLAVLGHIPYAPQFTAAQLKGLSVVEQDESPASLAIRDLWQATRQLLALPVRRAPER